MRKGLWIFITSSIVLCTIVYAASFDRQSSWDEILLLLAICFLGLIYFIVLNPLIQEVKEVKTIADLAKSSTMQLGFQEETQTELRSEIEEVKDVLNKLVSTFQSTTDFVNKSIIGSENMDFPASNQLTDSLISLKQHLATLSKKDNESRWVAESMAKFMDILKAKYNSDQEFYDVLISNLVKYVGANQGGLFLKQSLNGTDALHLVSCYAYNRKKFLQKEIAIGDGLIGQTFLEGDTVILKEIPQDYVTITSGLGGARPDFLIIVPLKLNEKVESIVELAAFEELEEFKIQFIEKVGESIASSIATARINEQTKKLLAESQSNTEELRAQEEEMRQNMEELQATQEEMGRKEKELIKMLTSAKDQQEHFYKGMAEMETLKIQHEGQKKDVIEILNAIPAKIFLKDKDGNMVLCNDEVARSYNLTIDQLIGTHDRDHFDPDQAMEFRKQELEVMTQGLKTFLQEENLNGTLRYLKTTKMPFFIHHLNQTGLLGYQFDVTETMANKARTDNPS